jgi:hypothetical protein
VCTSLFLFRISTGKVARAQSVNRLITGCTVRGSNPGVGVEISLTCPDRLLGPTQPPVQWVPGLS